MPDFAATHFAWPWAFFLLPMPWLIWRWMRVAPLGQALRLPYVGVALNAELTKKTTGTLPWILVFAWICLIVAAARPQTLGPPQAQEHSGRAVMLAVDLSGSMQTPDMQLAGEPVSRFGAVEAIADDFIARRSGDEVGLILFGTQAFLVTPLTYDLNAVRTQLHSAVVGLAGTQTAIGDAIAIAVKRLSALPEQSRVLVLLTDGVNNAGSIEPLDATRAAKAAGVKIYTIGIGATQMSVPGFFGTQQINPSEDLDANMLTQIAQQTGGQFYRATDTNELAQAYRAINALEPMPQHGPPLRLHHELFRGPLLAAFAWLLLALVVSRRAGWR